MSIFSWADKLVSSSFFAVSVMEMENFYGQAMH